jgi:hypothetical protein
MTLTRTAKGFKVLHSPHGALPLPGYYWVWHDQAEFLAEMVHEAVAPAVNRAKCLLKLPASEKHVWRWRDFLAIDDRIAIVENSLAAERQVLFGGFVLDVDWRYDGHDEDCTITAAGNAFRLARDVIVQGRWMLSKGSAVTHYSGLPCQFNPAGRPNRHPTLQHDIEGGPARGVAVFTHDFSVGADFWTIGDILDYLLWRYNAAQTWISNGLLSEADYARLAPIEISVEGRNLWEALADACRQAAYDAFELVSNDGNGWPASTIFLRHVGDGAVATVGRQEVNPDGTFPLLDLDQTNLLSTSVAESVASSVTRPMLAGGWRLYEVTVELGKAWDPSKLATPPGEKPWPDASPLYMPTFWSRFCTDGDAFPVYASVGRSWDANTDGTFSEPPFSLPVVDVALAADQPSNSWPMMPYVPLPALTAENANLTGPSQEDLVEISYDGGSTWERLLSSFRVAHDRLAVEITEKNLACISTGVPGAEYEQNLFWRLEHDGADVRMRLTCTIAAPFRAIQQPARQATAATIFETAEWFDRGILGQVRSQATGSALAGKGLAVDSADGSADLVAAALAIRDFSEDRTIEASVPLEWMDGIGLTDVVQQIGGINYSLAIKGGDSPRYPRVVARTLHLRPEAYSLHLVLGTERKAGIV